MKEDTDPTEILITVVASLIATVIFVAIVFSYNSISYTCDECRWEGEKYEMDRTYLYTVHHAKTSDDIIYAYYCPVCGHLIYKGE